MEIMNHIIKNWPIFLVALSSIVAVVATLISDSKDGDQKDNIERLGKENIKLSDQIKTLSMLNNNISSQIQTISLANKTASEKNLHLSTESQELISEVKKLTTKTKTLLEEVDIRANKQFAENLKSGELQLNFSQNFNDNVEFTLGTDVSSNTIKAIKNGAKLVKVYGYYPFVISFDEQNKIQLSMKVFDIHGNLIAEIEKNFWRPNMNFTGKFNYDNKGFEVIDNAGNVAMNVDINGNNKVRIQGVFPIIEIKKIFILGTETTLCDFKSPESEREIREDFAMSYEQYIDSQIKNVNSGRLFEYWQ